MSEYRLSLSSFSPGVATLFGTSIKVFIGIMLGVSLSIYSRMLRKNDQKFFDYTTPESAEKYNNKRFESVGGRLITRLEQAIALNFIKDSKLKNIDLVVDVGAGTGRMSEFVFKRIRPKKFVLFDSSAEMLKLAMMDIKKMNVKNTKVRSVLGDAENMVIRENSVDLLISFHLVKHIRNLNNFLKSVRRVIKNENGHAIIEVTNKYSIVQFWSDLARLRSIGEFRMECNKVGLKVEKYKGCNFFGETIFKFAPGVLLPLILLVDNLFVLILPNYSTKFIVLLRKI
jgi:ubiquinone/menaquinone biosynthesis C-methylase UbiE